MKKALAVLLGLNALLMVALLLKEKDALVHAEGGGGEVPVGNGDVNGDGEINIGDPVYLLEDLFRDGPDPVPIECPPPGSGGLPATGQTLCYDNDGAPIDCASADYPGQDGFYQAGCPTEGRFVDNEDGTVTDTCTGLMWQKGTADVSGNGSIGAEDLLNWQEALQYCEGLDFAGHDDWRLPNVRELQSIVDYGRYDPAIDPAFEAESDWYWSSTSYSHYPDFAWSVHFDDGFVVFYAKDFDGYVRAVRRGP